MAKLVPTREGLAFMEAAGNTLADFVVRHESKWTGNSLEAGPAIDAAGFDFVEVVFMAGGLEYTLRLSRKAL